ncbi:MAG: phosphoglycerate kinase [Proteobacteria bacterium]|nr:phosphoglycerate kinase [Pseudomonadota bacterium]
MKPSDIDPRLPVMQNIDLKDKIVLVRVDHNVVKKGKIKDPYRIDATIGTLFNIIDKGGRPILMTHVGRPRDKKTGQINIDAGTSVKPVVHYLERKLHIKIAVPDIPASGDQGIAVLGKPVQAAIDDLKNGRVSAIYLPNTRWFQGEEKKGDAREEFARQLSEVADVYINDAFGSWQPHASTFDINNHLPGYAGLLMQKEIVSLKKVMDPERPFVGIVAGSKYDTKIGPVSSLYKKADHLILGGVIYNTYLCAKYGINVKGVEASDISLAKELVALDKDRGKIVELPFVVESDMLDQRIEGNYRKLDTRKFKKGDTFSYFLDIDPSSFDLPEIRDILLSARTIFLNAVMGFTPNFHEGSEAFYRLICENKTATKLFGGGDTLQEFKVLNPGLYLKALDDESFYFFTGGGAVLKAIEEGTPYGLDGVKALLDNKKS